MPTVIGNNAKFQVGLQADWSTIVAPTTAIEITKESFRLIKNYKESDALVGRKAASRMDIMSRKFEGEFSLIANPDNIGLLLAMLFGEEADPAAVDGSAVYDHTFTPMSANVSSSLPKGTFTIDRGVAVFGYFGGKLNTMAIEASSEDYLRATFNVRGYDETTDTTEPLAYSTKLPFIFKHGSVTIDGTTYDEVRRLTYNYNNNLEDNLYVMNGDERMIEIECQKREATAEVEVLYTSDVNTLRTNKFIAGATCSAVFVFQSTEEVLTGKYYTLTLTIPLAYIMQADPQVQGPDRISLTLSLKGTESASAQVSQAVLRDGRATKWGV
jgi:hypothetical protein